MKTCTHNGKEYYLVEPEYSTEDTVLSDLASKGYAFLSNAANINYDITTHKEYSLDANYIDVCDNVYIGTEAYNTIIEKFKNTTAFKIISKLNNVRQHNLIVYRMNKNNKATSMHRDDCFSVNYALKTDFLTCWVALNDISLEAGPLAIDQKHPITFTEQDIKEANVFTETCLEFDDVEKNLPAITKYIDKCCYRAPIQNKMPVRLIARGLKAGDCVLFTQDVVHGSLDNYGFLRVSLDIRFFYNCDPKNTPLNRSTAKL
jgi:ectoine hydroxylase-related dioxygenase (phytanoyl-CoA dioxygenase family)